MPNYSYADTKRRFLDNQFGDEIVVKAQLVNTTLVAFDKRHSVLSDIPSEAFIGQAATVSGLGDPGGVTHVKMHAVSGPLAGAFVLFKDTGSTTESPLIAWVDSAIGLPVTPNGGDIEFTFHNNCLRRLIRAEA